MGSHGAPAPSVLWEDPTVVADRTFLEDWRAGRAEGLSAIFRARQLERAERLAEQADRAAGC